MNTPSPLGNSYLCFRPPLRWSLLQEVLAEPQTRSKVPSSLSHPNPAHFGLAPCGDGSVCPTRPGKVELGSLNDHCVPSTWLGKCTWLGSRFLWVCKTHSGPWSQTLSCGHVSGVLHLSPCLHPLSHQECPPAPFHLSQSRLSISDPTWMSLKNLR